MINHRLLKSNPWFANHIQLVAANRVVCNKILAYKSAGFRLVRKISGK